MVQTQRGFSYYILCDYLNPILIHHRSQSNDSTAGYYRFTTYQDARRVRLVDGLEYLKQIFYEYHPLKQAIGSIFNVPLGAVSVKIDKVVL